MYRKSLQAATKRHESGNNSTTTLYIISLETCGAVMVDNTTTMQRKAGTVG